MDQSFQPIPTFHSQGAAEAAYAQTAAERTKPRFTKAERRQHAKEKRAAQQPSGRGPNRHEKKHAGKRAGDPIPHASGLNDREIDAMILRLVSMKAKKSDTKRLENRVTRDVEKPKVKKELSEAKLAKIQKRREVRAERKQAWLKKKAEAEAAGGQVQGAATATATTAFEEVQTVATPAPVPAEPDSDDEHIFDDLE